MSNLGKVGLCLAGGGGRGIIQLGQIKALLDYGIDYDVLFGCSVGALNGCLMHQGDMEKAEELWMSIKTSDVYSFNPILDAWRPFSRDSASIYNSDPLKKLLKKNVNFSKLKDNPKPFFVNCSDFSNWTNLRLELKDFLDEGEFLQFLLGSASPPVLFPKQKFRGSIVCDGGIVSNWNIEEAVKEGCDTIFLLSPTTLTHKADMANAKEMLDLVTTVPAYADLPAEIAGISTINKIIDKVNESLEPNYKRIRLIIIKPSFPIDLDLLDFNYKLDRKSLISTGYEIARQALDKELA
jgi:predicted acylesterase/phospholipase RssA